MMMRVELMLVASLQLLLFTAGASHSECHGQVSPDGQCNAAPEAQEQSSETSALVQSRLNLKGKITPPVDPEKLVKPHLREFLNENTKFIAGVPVFQYHRVHEGGMNPSALELKEQKDWLVEFEDSCTNEGLSSFCSSLVGEAKCELIGHPSEHGLAFVELLASEEELQQLMEKGGECKIDFVEPNVPINAIPEVDVEEGASLLEVEGVVWGIDRVDQRSGLDGEYHLSDAGKGVTVYVADTGVRCTHEEFTGRCTLGADWTMGGGQKDCSAAALLEEEESESATETDLETGSAHSSRPSSDTPCGQDKQGHGTHCAGSIGGTKMGLAKKASIVSLKVLSDRGSGSMSGIMGSVDYVLSKSGPRIWSASLGGKGNDAASKEAIQKATDGGVVISVAAGNSNDDACKYTPAFAPAAITVAASDKNDKSASFTNYGSCIDIWGPGVDIVSAGVKSDTATDKMSGTSMACPHVSGGAAVILGNNPGLTPVQVLETMLEYATDGKISGEQQTGDTANKLLYVEPGMAGGGGGQPPSGGKPPSGGQPPSGPCPPASPGSPGAAGPSGPAGPPGPPGPPR